MKIIRIDVYGYEVRYAHGTYVMSGGREATHEDGTLVRLRTDEGLDGWGEVTTLGRTYLPVSPGTIHAGLAELAPALLGLDPTNIAQVLQVMDATVLGQPFAKSPVDIACWDLAAQAVGRPVAWLLGGVLSQRWPLYEAVPLGTPDQMASFVSRRRAEGITRFQLKVGNDPRDDVTRTRACVEAAEASTAAGATIVADANGGWDLASARIAVAGLAGLPVFVEQPCRSTADSALAHAGSLLPLVLDESVWDVADAVAAKTAGASSVNLKISRLGGLTKTALVRDVLVQLGLRVSLEDMWGGDVITAAVSHLAASTVPSALFMTSFFNDWTDGHLAGRQPRSVAGWGSAPTGAGLGIKVDEARLGEPLFWVEL